MYKISPFSAITKILACACLCVLLQTHAAQAYVAQDFSWIPPFTAAEDEKPTVHVIFDSSGSMRSRAYPYGSKPFNVNKPGGYQGYCDPQKYYVYNTGEARFEPTNQTPHGQNQHLWSGSFLNWCIMHRMEIGKWAMTGGRYDKHTDTLICEPVNRGSQRVSKAQVTKGGTTVIPYPLIAPVTIQYSQVEFYTEEYTIKTKLKWGKNKKGQWLRYEVPVLDAQGDLILESSGRLDQPSTPGSTLISETDYPQYPIGAELGAQPYYHNGGTYYHKSAITYTYTWPAYTDYATGAIIPEQSKSINQNLYYRRHYHHTDAGNSYQEQKFNHQANSQYGFITTSYGSYKEYRTVIKGDGKEPTGAVDNFKDKVRMSLFTYHPSNQGAELAKYTQENSTGITDLKKNINAISAYSWTPLGESLYTVMAYIQQQQSNINSYYGPRYDLTSYPLGMKGKTGDPFYFTEPNQLIPCTAQQVLLITDGESTMDTSVAVPYAHKAPSGYRDDSITIYHQGHTDAGSNALQDVAWWGHTTDLRSDIPGLQNMNFFAVYAAFGAGTEAGKSLLKQSCALGQFPDANGDGEYDEEDLNKITTEHGDKSWMDSPKSYFQADNAEELVSSINAALNVAAGNRRSGTAAAVSQQGKDGDGAIFQAFFFPPGSEEAPGWAGQVHAFFSDKFGNMREDTNHNAKLDAADQAIQFTDKGKAARFTVAKNGTLTANDTVELSNLNLLWSSSNWLNRDATGLWTNSPRPYNSTIQGRYIFTFADANKNMICNAGEQQAFAVSAGLAINSASSFASYLTLQENTAGALGALPANNATWTDLAAEQIRYVRGEEIEIDSLGTELRSRRLKKNGAATGKVWPLGDILYSSPTAVSAPAENYHLIYGDKTYEAFYKKYRHRRQVVYAGGNDGMLHAFNAGFYNSTFDPALQAKGSRFDLQYNGETEYPLGAELWAYIPHNLLPHLRWTMNKNYEKALDDTVAVHIAGVDLKPRIFDARIFTPDDDHPHGWGTVLVAGMRLGGAEVLVDVLKDGTPEGKRTMSSAYAILDITNPEKAPVLLGEVRMPGLGFTTCFPTVMPMGTAKTKHMTTEDPSKNQWHLVFGSGPADANGRASRSKLGVETSDQKAKLYIMDLKDLAQNKRISTAIANLDELRSMIAPPIAVDLDLGASNNTIAMKTDAVYFGTASGDQTNAGGSMYRLYTENEQLAVTAGNTTNWKFSKLLDAGMPITEAASAATDHEKRLWVYFGGGRYFNRKDIPQQKAMSFFGIKEPIKPGNYTFGEKKPIDWNATIHISSLYNSTDKIPPAQHANWVLFEEHASQSPGWRHDLTANNSTLERVVGQASVLGGAVFFSSYIPTRDICQAGGSNRLYGLYYRTGTPYYKGIFRRHISDTSNPASVDGGSGVGSSPSLGINEKGEVTVTIGRDDGTMQTISTDTPFNPRSHTLFWMER